MYQINSEMCKEAADCVEACPVSAIARNEAGKFGISDDCTDCGACEAACDEKAIQRVH